MNEGRGAYFLAFGAVLLLAFLNALGSLGRPFWMDEAITIMEFASRPSFFGTYFSYDIPNNHILFTYVVRLCLGISDYTGTLYGWMLRVPSLIFGVAGLAILFLACVRKGGLQAGSSLIAFMGMSGVFAIYATAVRGYMLSFLLVSLALVFAPALLRRGSFWRHGLYFLVCLAAVGTIPTNLIALEAVALLVIGWPSSRRLARKTWLFLAPAFALGLFYLPILPKFIKCLTLGEGWSSAPAAAWNLYGCFLLVFLPLIPLALWGAFELWRRRPGRRSAMLIPLGLALLPLLLIFLGRTTPFPRVFLPYWPVWMLLLAPFLGRGLRELKTRFPALKMMMALALLLCVWSAVTMQGREPLRNLLFGDGFSDDLLLPRYMEPGFKPDVLAKRIAERRKETPDLKVFLTFNADHYSIIMHGKFLDIPEETWLFDSPKLGKVKGIPADSTVLLVCAGRKDLDAVLSRFDLREGELLLDTGAQQLYCISGKSKP